LKPGRRRLVGTCTPIACAEADIGYAAPGSVTVRRSIRAPEAGSARPWRTWVEFDVARPFDRLRLGVHSHLLEHRAVIADAGKHTPAREERAQVGVLDGSGGELQAKPMALQGLDGGDL
jgi:hypothetical protein